MANDVVLDASALMVLLHGDAGCDAIERSLPDAAISSVTLAETASRLAMAGMPDAVVAEVFANLALPVIEFDEAQAIEAGRAGANGAANLPFERRAALALARVSQAQLLTADSSMADSVADCEIQLVS